MARRWVNLVGVTPWLLEMMVSVPQMVVAPLVLAQSNQTNQSSQPTEAQSLYNEGKQLQQKGTKESLQQALEKYQQALLLFRAARDRNGEATTLNRIGGIYYSLGQPQQALNYLQQALPIGREVGDRSGEASTLSIIGDVYEYKIGQPQLALNYYQQALTIYREVRNSTEERLRQRSSEASTLRGIGFVYRGMGQSQEAINYFQQALTISRELGIRSQEAFDLTGIGAIYRDIEQPEQALNYLQQALTISREREVSDSTEERLRRRYEEGSALDVIGGVYRRIGQPQEALNYFQQSLTISREVGNRYAEAFDLISIGAVYRRNLGQPQEALNYYQQALSIFKELGKRSEEARVLNDLALVHQALNDLPAALQNIQDAISIVEDIRGQLIDPDSRTSYFATVQSYYKLQVDLLMELNQQNPNQGYNIQAFNVTERSKARTLLELLTESKADIRTGVDPQLLQQEREIQSQLTALDKRRIELASTRLVLSGLVLSGVEVVEVTDNKEQITALETQRETLQTQYRNLQSQIRQTSPKYAALKYPQPLTLEQIQQQILDDNTVILSYSLGKDKSYLWLISKTEMTSYELPKQKIIEDLINKKVRSQLTNRAPSRDTFISETSELGNLLLKPILEKIGNKRLVIISDGALQYIPFGALPDPRVNDKYQPLLVNNEINYLPSATTLQTIRTENQNRTPAPRSIAILADPVFDAKDPRVRGGVAATSNNELSLAAQNLDRAARDARGGGWDRLPGTRQEAETILRLFPPDRSLSQLGFQANRTNAQSNQLSQYRFIHWATHGFVNAQKPELSGIVMSLVQENGQPQDGYLLLGDIFNLSFNADLVVLSACETGLGEIVQGEGLIGLTRGLMYAGTPRVVTSLWSVPDEQTAILMGKFYEKMLQQNLPPAQALRAAQLEIFRTQGKWSPYHWAAFTLQGEWR